MGRVKCLLRGVLMRGLLACLNAIPELSVAALRRVVGCAS